MHFYDNLINIHFVTSIKESMNVPGNSNLFCKLIYKLG